ncbi:MAG: DMT family transporter [Candidatus Nomurabacteria bacterium]|nr:DMT family transporter [Candidatus Nomurabacteria bacterium]
MENMGLIYSLSAAVCWGVVYALDQKVLEHISPISLMFFYSVFSVIVLLPFMLLNNNELFKSFFNSGKDNLTMASITIVLAIAANLLILFGIKSLGASHASILEIAYPFFVILFSFLIFRTSPSIYFYIGGLLIFIGSVIITKLS